MIFFDYSLARNYGQQLQTLPVQSQMHAEMNSQATAHYNAANLWGYVPRGATANLTSPAIARHNVWLTDKIRGTNTTYTQDWFDIANVYSPTLNPIKWVSGLADPFMLFKVHLSNNQIR